MSESVWSGDTKDSDDAVSKEGAVDVSTMASGETDIDPSSFTMPAEESRDRCVICGINFKMFFDNDDGIYMYNNCREIEVLNDEAAAKEKEDLLVHVTCWKALGAPETLTADQTLQDTIDLYAM